MAMQGDQSFSPSWRRKGTQSTNFTLRIPFSSLANGTDCADRLKMRPGGLDDDTYKGSVDSRFKYMYIWQYPASATKGRFVPGRLTVSMGEYRGGRSTWLKRFTDKGEWKPMTLNIALNPNISMRDNILDGDVMWSSLVQPYLPDVLVLLSSSIPLGVVSIFAKSTLHFRSLLSRRHDSFSP